MTSDEKDCERCGAPIPPRRLEALPDTRLCIECSEAIGGDYKTFAIPVNTGKPGSNAAIGFLWSGPGPVP